MIFIYRAILFLGLSSCSWISPPTYCEGSSDVLVDGAQPLSCDDAMVAVTYVSMTAGRRTGKADRNLILGDIKAIYSADPDFTRTALNDAAQAVARMKSVSGMEAARARSEEAYRAVTENGPLSSDRTPAARDSLKRRVAPWLVDHETQLVLDESDIEGWIRYASLCREVQSGGPLKLSINNREQVYREVKRGFEDGSEQQKEGWIAFGGFWNTIEDRWRAATYEEQQAWIQVAPLPPPMTGTSMGYASVIFEGDARQHAATFHEKLGPLKLDTFE